MVMHARKYPRHNDGYYDRAQVHPFEDKYPSKSSSSGGSGSYNDRYGDRTPSKDSPPGAYRMRDDHSPGRPSPGRPSPRYQNKSGYKDRLKDRPNKGSTSSPGERLNHHYNSSRDERHAPPSAASKPYKSLESLKTTEPKDPKTEQIQKNALRVSGDWSEHRSSSGKKYYYNCKSEVSQWEKPKDWIELASSFGRPVEASRAKDRNGRDSRPTFTTPTSSTKSSDERYRHLSGSSHGYPSSSAPSSSSASSSRGIYTSPSSSRHKDSSSSSSSHPMYDGVSRGHHEGPRGHDGSLRTSHDGSLRAGQDGSLRAGAHDGQRSRTLSTDSSSRTYSATDTSSSSLHRIPVLCRSNSDHVPRDRAARTSRDDRHSDDYHHHGSNHGKASAYNGAARHPSDPDDVRQSDDMDISPGSTPTGGSRPNSHTGTPSSSRLNSAPHVGGLGSPQGTMGNNLTQAIQTLQKLQQALMAQQQHQLQQQQHTNSGVGESPQGDATPPHAGSLPSPHYPRGGSLALQRSVDEDMDAGHSPKSDRLHRNNRNSPTLSSSVTLSGSSLSAINTKGGVVQLTATLSNYYKDSLVEHTTNIPADQAERQANRYGEEAHSVGTLHCTQVSVDLKRARSLVRIAEIQATLQEQRVLFLRQETKDLENMRSQNSFMPSQPGGGGGHT